MKLLKITKKLITKKPFRVKRIKRYFQNLIKIIKKKKEIKLLEIIKRFLSNKKLLHGLSSVEHWFFKHRLVDKMSKKRRKI